MFGFQNVFKSSHYVTCHCTAAFEYTPKWGRFNHLCRPSAYSEELLAAKRWRGKSFVGWDEVVLIMAPLASNGSCYTAEDIQAAPHLDARFSVWSSDRKGADGCFLSPPNTNVGNGKYAPESSFCWTSRYFFQIYNIFWLWACSAKS